MQKQFVSFFISLFIALVSVSLTPAFAKSDGIIYEYETITQKKGEALDKALKKTQLSRQQISLVKTIPVLKKASIAEKTRFFRFIYLISRGKYLLREVKISQGKENLSYVLSPQNHKEMIRGYSRISTQAIKKRSTKKNSQNKADKTQLEKSKVEKVKTEAPKTEKAKVKKAKSEKAKEKAKADKKSSKSTAKKLKVNAAKKIVPLIGYSLTQKKGQSFESVLKNITLTNLQKDIILKGDYRKSALSQRTIKLYFEKSGRKKLLRGVAIVRGKQQIGYVVKPYKKTFSLVSFKKLTKEEKQQAQQSFAKARMTVLKSKSQSTNQSKKKDQKTQTKKTQTKKTGKQLKIKRSGGYTLVSFKQKKGQSLSSAIKKVSLTYLQHHLISKMPATKSAKSTRYFYLLFETKKEKKKNKNVNKKHLRALRVVRGKSVAEYVLVKYKDKWLWANKSGQVTLSNGKSKARTRGPYPLRYDRVSSPYNLRRRHPISRRIRPHKGVDLAAKHGTPIYAPASGVVKFAGRQRGYGIIVEIDHKNGYVTKYAHLSRIARGVRRGTSVKGGQFIARVGNTGRSTGPHLHYEILVNGRPRNPAFTRIPNSVIGKSLGVKKTLKQAKKNVSLYLPKLRALAK